MAKNDHLLTAEFVRSALHYDPETGAITRASSAGNRLGGTVASSVSCGGYLRVSISGSRVLCHRLAFLWMTGHWPCGVIDHINGIKTDNRWANLRDVSHSVNCQNQRRAKCRTASGMLGVYLLKDRPKAAIFVDGKQIHLGTFDTKEQAYAAYVEAKRRLHEGCTI